VDKVVAVAAEAVADIRDGAKLAVGGFGLCGVPDVLIDALLAQGTTGLHVASNNLGVGELGLGKLLHAHRIARATASYIGDNKEFARQFLAGELELELIPQGTLAERLRCAGVGIPAFYTPAGAGTLVESGGIPWRYDSDGTVLVSSPPRPTARFTVDGAERTFVLEESFFADFALVRAAKGDRHGNLVFSKSARNFNPLAAMSAKVAIAEVEQLVPVGEIGADDVHLPGIFVHRVVPLTREQAAHKPIEKPTVRSRKPTAEVFD
jgi:3-oxoacid CoA-transferase subunit A